MSQAITVRPLAESEYDEWGCLLSGSEQGSLYSHPHYLDALCTAAGGRFCLLGAFRGTELARRSDACRR